MWSLYLTVIVDNYCLVDYSVAMLFSLPDARSFRSFFTVILVIFLLLLGSGVVNAGTQACRLFADRGTEADRGSGTGCCCRGGENSKACSGLKAQCGQQAHDPFPVSISHNEHSTIDVAPTSMDVFLSVLGTERVPKTAFGHEIVQRVNLNLLC
jgi:hypothetical protein